MTKKNYIFILLIMFAIDGFSQISKLKFGINGGLNYSKLRGYELPIDPYWYSEKPGLSFLGGINLEYVLNDKISLKSGLNFEQKIQKGMHHVEVVDADPGIPPVIDYKSKEQFNYLVLPILLKYSFTTKNSFFLNGGIFSSLLLNSKITDNLEKYEIDSPDFVTTKHYKKNDFGLVFGVGKTFDLLNNHSISIELRENLGLANINKQPVWGDGNKKTNSLNFSLSYGFN